MIKFRIICFVVSLSVIIHPVLFASEIKSIHLKEVLSIGTPEDDLIFFITSVTTDEKGFIYLTDSLDYSIKKFDVKGVFIRKAGRKGQGPGEFQIPVLIEHCRGMIYVADQSALGVQVFDSDFNFKGRLPLEFFLFDIMFLPDNNVFIHSPLIKNDPPIIRIRLEEMQKFRPSLSVMNENFWQKSGKFTIDHEENIYYISTFVDKIEKYDKNIKRIWQKNLFEGKKSREIETKEGAKIGIKSLPTEMVYKDISLDKAGHLFILSGQSAKNRSRDIYILDGNGKYLTTVVLPEPTHMIHIDSNNFLYSRAGEGTTLKKYALEYVDK